MSLRALILGVKGDWGLMGSYGRAFESLGAQTSYFNLVGKVESYARLGEVGRTLSKFVSVEPWIAKGNRDLITAALELQPDVLVCTSSELRAGALAQIKAASPRTNIVLVWPDTMLNLSDRMIHCLKVADVVASYSKASIPLLQKLGAERVVWAPFAMDTELFPDVRLSTEEQERFGCDIGFVGNHRPERERDILRMVDAGLRVKVWASPWWTRHAANKARLKEYFQGGPLLGKDLAKALRGSTLAVNMIDPTNYPSANMRFFETYASRATPLCSHCPEMAEEFRDGETIFYFQEGQVVERALELLKNRDRLGPVGQAGRVVADQGHRYADRVRGILDALPR